MQREKIVLLVQVARYFNRRVVVAKRNRWVEHALVNRMERDSRMTYARELAGLVKPTVWNVERFGLDTPLAKVVAHDADSAYALFVCQCQDDGCTVFGNEFVTNTGAKASGGSKFVEWCE